METQNTILTKSQKDFFFNLKALHVQFGSGTGIVAHLSNVISSIP